MSWTSGQLAERFRGRLIGPDDVELRRLDTLRDADAHSISFVRDASRLAEWGESRAGAAFIASDVLEEASSLPETPGRALIAIASPDRAMVELLAESDPGIWRPGGVHPGAHIDPDAQVDPGASVGACATVGPRSSIGAGSVLHPGAHVGADVTIGPGCEIHAGAVVQDRCTLGAGVVLHAGVVIGTDGFGYVPAPDGRGLAKVPHVGDVVIDEGVEIGANTCIDRGKFGSTRIGAGTKIDNLVQIGHNCEIGRCCIICGGAGISGSVRIGDGVTIAGGVGIADNRTIGSGATIAAGSGVMNDIPEGQRWGGYPAREARAAVRIIKAVDELPQLMRKVRRLIDSSTPE